MAPFRASRSTRSGRPGGQTDHDVFDGLPVRQWRLQETTIQPPAIEAQNAFGLAQAVPQETVPGKPFDKWAVERPLPKGSELYAPWCQQILRAGRAGKPAKKKDPATIAREREEKENDEEANSKDAGQKVFTARKWLQTPRHMEEPEREYLAKRRKGLTSAFALTAEGTVINIAPVEHVPVVEERRRNVPPRRKPRKGFQKKKKMSDGAGLGVSASAEALAAQKEAEAQAAAHNDGDTPMHDDDDGEDDDDDDAEEGDEDDGDADADGDDDGDADDGEGNGKGAGEGAAKQADLSQETPTHSVPSMAPGVHSEGTVDSVNIAQSTEPASQDGAAAILEQSAPVVPQAAADDIARPGAADLPAGVEAKAPLDDAAHAIKEPVAEESLEEKLPPADAVVSTEELKQAGKSPETKDTRLTAPTEDIVSTEQATTDAATTATVPSVKESLPHVEPPAGRDNMPVADASSGAPVKVETEPTAEASAETGSTSAPRPDLVAETDSEAATQPDTQSISATGAAAPSQAGTPEAENDTDRTMQ